MESSARNLSVALAAALIVHLLVLALQFSVEPSNLTIQRPLTVSFNAVKEEDEQVKEEAVDAPVEALVSEPEIKIKEKTPASISAEEVIVASKPNVNSKPEVVIQTSLQSNAFKRFLKAETDALGTTRNKNNIEEERFNNSFLSAPRYESPQALSPFTGDPVLAGNGVFATELNGKRTCYAEIINLLDPAAGSSFTSQRCTHPKKFNLDIEKPNNGWTDR